MSSVSIDRLSLLVALLCLAGTGPSAAQWTDDGDAIHTGDRVGIGTSSPDASVHVRGAKGSDGGGADVYADAENSILGVDARQSRLGFVKKWGWPPVIGAGSGTSIMLGHWSTEQLLGNVQGGSFTPDVTIDPDGQVGVGTTNPKQPIHIQGSGYPSLTIETTETSSNGSANLDFVNGDGEQWQLSGPRVHQGNRFNLYWNGGNGWQARVSVQPDGNVGIGTQTPEHKLSVNGTTRTKEVIVETKDWPDYVFDPDYDLRTPAELAAVIEREGHLPALPSAETVEAGGQTVGEVQRGLVQTVEELARYVIEHDRRADEQSSTLDSLRQANARLQRESGVLRDQLNELRSRLKSERRRNDRQEARIQKLETQLQQLLPSDTTE